MVGLIIVQARDGLMHECRACCHQGKRAQFCAHFLFNDILFIPMNGIG